MHLQIIADGTLIRTNAKMHISITQQKKKHGYSGKVLCNRFIHDMLVCEITGIGKSDICKKCMRRLIDVHELSSTVLSKLGVIDTDSF